MHEDAALSVETAAPLEALWSIVDGTILKRDWVDDGRVNHVLEIRVHS